MSPAHAKPLASPAAPFGKPPASPAAPFGKPPASPAAPFGEPEGRGSNDRPAPRSARRPAAPPDRAKAGRPRAPTDAGPAERVGLQDWPALARELDDLGCALTGPILSPDECRAIAALYDDPGLFRSTIDMARYRFGAGQYRYFDRPLPGLVAALRAAFWPHLVPIARAWADRLGQPAPWPDALDDWLEQCGAAGQTRPTPLLLRYGPGDWNALHRDLYGDLVFPLQIVIGLDEPGVDYTGGEFLLVEQRPRAQSRGTTTPLARGRALVFTTRDRPVPSARGWSAAPVRHGVSVVRSGRRHALGLVFHDAR